MIGEADLILLSLFAGAAIGSLYLGLLWASVRVLPLHRGALLFAALGLVRAALVIAALAAALRLEMSPGLIATAVVGFIAVRVLLTRMADPGTGAIPWK